MFMQRTQQEVQGAGQAVNWNQREVNPVINYDALATASLINSALLDDGKSATGSNPANLLGVKRIKNMRNLAAKLSFNTLVPWMQGAALLVADYQDFKYAFHPAKTARQADGSLEFDAGDLADHEAWMKRCWHITTNAADAVPTEFLRALRRANGNNWDSSLQAAAFLETKKLSQQREQMWGKLPAVTTADNASGIHDWY